MAIDTRDKRASCLGFCSPAVRVLPNPDGLAFDGGDRLQIVGLYRGVTAVAGMAKVFFFLAAQANVAFALGARVDVGFPLGAAADVRFSLGASA